MWIITSKLSTPVETQNRAACKIIAAGQEARSYISNSIERTARLAAKCHIKDLYTRISIIYNFSGKES